MSYLEIMHFILSLKRIFKFIFLIYSRLAIFQLLDDTEDMAPCMAFFSFLMGCANVPLNIFLIAGACCRKSCLIMPWIVITLLEHLIVGVPLIIFMGLISLYLAAQLHLYIQAACLMGFIITLFFLSMSSWVSLFLHYKGSYISHLKIVFNDVIINMVIHHIILVRCLHLLPAF